MANLKGIKSKGWKSKVIDITYPVAEGIAGLRPALDRICQEARQAIQDGYSLIVLSDRRISADRVPISSLMAVGTVHHHLVRHEERTRIGLLVESGEAREVHHFCLLIGYGADAVNPYLALYALRQARLDGKLSDDWDDDRIVAAYRSGVAHGMLKVMAKMGISTLQSYKGAQIFEALGLSDEVVNICFAGTPSRIKGVGFDVLGQESLMRHHVGFPDNPDSISPELPQSRALRMASSRRKARVESAYDWSYPAGGPSG
jgi:glutamate synthase (NADPH/NADH) large chain